MDLDRLEQVFRDVLTIDDDAQVQDLRYGQTPGWDSLAHMQLIAELEEAFDVVLEPDDVVELSDFSSARDILDRRGAGAGA